MTPSSLAARSKQLFRGIQSLITYPVSLFVPTEFRNVEGISEYYFQLHGRLHRRGCTAMLRVKNEEKNIIQCLTSIYSAFDEIVVVDNASADATEVLVSEFARDRDPEGKVKLFKYPFQIARYGHEHRSADERSVHSTAYYYNWCLAKCTRAYVAKWDADMILVPGQANVLASMIRSLPLFPPRIIVLPVQTVYKRGDSYYAARGEINREMRVFPNIARIHFKKAEHWEALQAHPWVRRIRPDVVTTYELKDTSADEFDHWTGTDFPTKRKQREWHNFNLVRSGQIDDSAFDLVDIGIPVADV